MIFTTDQQLVVDELFIGGIDRKSRSTIDQSNYYSDDMEIADVRLNNYELFEAETMRSKRARFLIDEDASSSAKVCAKSECFRPLRITNDVNFTIEMKMKPVYRRFLEVDRPIQNNLTLVFGFNFTMARFNQPYHTQIVLLRSHRSMLVLNILLKRIELRLANRVRAWLDFNATQEMTTMFFTLISFKDKTRLRINTQMVSLVFIKKSI